MFAITRGPSRKPGLRGDEEQRALADQRRRRRTPARSATPPSVQPPATCSRRTAFIVLPSTGPRPPRAGSEQEPRAVSASDVAISTIVRFAVWTRGSRMMPSAVRHRLDPGVRAAAERVRAHEEQQRPGHAERRKRVTRRWPGSRASPPGAPGSDRRSRPAAGSRGSPGTRRRSGRCAVTDSLTPRRFITVSSAMPRARDRQLVTEPARRQEAEDRVGARGDRDR